MKISISDGMTIAEKQAWAKTGEKHRWWFTWGKRFVPAGLIVGGAAYGIYSAVSWVSGAVGSVDAPNVPSVGIPAAVWFVAALLLVTTIVGIRVASRAIRFTPVAAIYIGLGIAWCGIIAYAVGIA